MCSNRAIVDSVECYMDELVECFEDFVKKSLIIISVGIGVIVGMLVYFMRVVSDRPPISNDIADTATAHNEIRNMTVQDEIDNVMRKEEIINRTQQTHFHKEGNLHLEKDNGDQKATTGVNTIVGLAPSPRFDEKKLRDVGMSSCSKLGCCGRTNSHSYIPCRVPIPILSPAKRKSAYSLQSSKHYTPSMQMCLKHIKKQDSCCVMRFNNEHLRV